MKRLLFAFMLLFFVFLSVKFCHAADVTLQWAALNDPGLLGYKLYLTDDQAEPEKWNEPVSKDVSEYTAINLMPGDTYYFYLNTIFAGGEGESSNTVSYAVPAYIPTYNPKPTLIIIPGASVTIGIK